MSSARASSLVASAPVEGARPTVAIENLEVGYRTRRGVVPVVDGVSLEIAPGEAYGLVGESGCGKTTLALALMRALPANAVVRADRLDFDGEDLRSLTPRELRRIRGARMALVAQNAASALNPTLRVGDQVAEIFRCHRRLPPAEALEAAARMLARVRLPDPARLVRRYPHQLSGGQQQRVLIAMALATDPDLLVLDEPTTGLDATVEAEVLDLVEYLRADFHAAILFVSHNLRTVARLCDRVGVLYAGRLVEEAPAEDLFHAPRHPYTLALLRCVPRLATGAARVRLEPIPGSLPRTGARIAGCVYADRCPLVRDRCRREAPPAYPVGGDRASRCHYHEEVPGIPPAASAELEERPPDEDVVLRVRGLEKRYATHRAEVHAVRDVSFEIRRREVFGLVGESGSGKSSLARCLVGLEAPSGGTVELEGRPLPAAHRDRSLRRRVQMVFQDANDSLNPRHSVGRMLARSVRVLGGVGDRARCQTAVADLAAAVRLDPRDLAARPRALSGGMKQRVAIARSFAGSPALVVCDEPVSDLDVSVQAAILNLLRELKVELDVSYLFISHDLAVIGYLADRVGVMYLGGLVEVGPVEAVYRPPHHPYTEALLSAIPPLELEQPRTRIRLAGTTPSGAEPITGCPFHLRCPRQLGPLCRETQPPWQRDGDGHEYRCHLPPGELAEAQLADRRAARVGPRGRSGEDGPPARADGTRRRDR